MASTRQFTLPNEKFRLEEINMPEELAASLAGRTVAVEVMPKVPSRTLRIDLDNPPVGVSVKDAFGSFDGCPNYVIEGSLDHLVSYLSVSGSRNCDNYPW